MDLKSSWFLKKSVKNQTVPGFHKFLEVNLHVFTSHSNCIYYKTHRWSKRARKLFWMSWTMEKNGTVGEAGDDELLLCIDDVKYRSASNGHSIGQLRVYETRIAWADNAGHEVYSVHYKHVKRMLFCRFLLVFCLPLWGVSVMGR